MEKKLDILSELPAELSELILSYLDADDLCRASVVSKFWYQLTNSDYLWKGLCLLKEIPDEKLPSELGMVSQTETCRWAKIYQSAERRAFRWADDRHKWLQPWGDQQSATSLCINGTTMVIGGINSISVLCIDKDTLIPVQELRTNAYVAFIEISDNTIVCVCDKIVLIFVRKDCVYVTEAVLSTCEDAVLTESSPPIEKDSNEEWPRMMLVLPQHIWFCTSLVCKIYDRVKKSFTNFYLSDIVTVKKAGPYVVILRPSMIQVHSEDGGLVFTLNDCAFYTGLATSSIGMAFLQCQDFCDPEAVYVDLKTRSMIVESSLKIYKLTLHRDIVLSLSGQNQFQIVCKKGTTTQWTTSLQGTKYIRPGKDFFQIICSRFVFVCPSKGRLDMFSLFDLKTGVLLYDTCINISAYNILQVTDHCLAVRTRDRVVQIRSYA